jgi:hydrophobic/amphiphilic exporter-1 (mainly G- bacteria), HAE1 family
VMLQNMLLAVACIYLVMAALFESVLAPSAIISGILFSFVGVYWFFLATGTEFSFMAMIGMLVLMGVVVNNGIVLIDHVNQLRAGGLERRQALIQGSCDRLRPILMTAATTLLGMVPLAIEKTATGGYGAPPYFPMARAVIGGLLFATVVSLIVLPTIYVALEDAGEWGRRALRRAQEWPRPKLSRRTVASGPTDGRVG